mmetsp:Transcript_44294/g.88514  ORF Transcript_44294/g.88514 Transcript_44294/m.88514 type:complete len:246 (-) Transcript_44294:107-844(-)
MFARWAALLSTVTAASMQAPKRIVWVRHGEVNSGLKPGAVYGGADVPLSSNGEAEARAAAASIAAGVVGCDPPVAVFCSPLARAVFGAEAVVRACGLPPPTALDGFREVGRGDWYGLTPSEITETYGENANMATFVDEPSFKPPGGESLDDVVARVLPARDAVLEAIPHGATAVVVSHLFVTRTVVHDALRAQGDMILIGDIDIPTASISCIEYPADNPAGGKVLFSGRKPEALTASANDLTGAS